MKPGFESRSNLIWWISLLGICLAAFSALRSVPQIADLLMTADGDDLMRLVQVRDLLGGQSWFDTRQYRVLPPEGISMHWSRYLDAGIAGVKTAAELVLSPTQAELATVILWPFLLASIMVIILAQGTARLFGTWAALGAVPVFLTWSKLGGEFVAPRIDHHNAQILFATAAFYLAVIPGHKRLLGALAGCATAMALAIGLEMLPTFAVIWGLMALRHAFDEEGSGDWLIGFAAAFSLSAPLLMAGQTAPSNWAVLHCDVLALPVIALGSVGVVATLVPVFAARRLTGPLSRILTLVALTGTGLVLTYPILGHCLAGPYAQVTPDVRQIIEQNVTEARSASLLLTQNPVLLGSVLAPPLLIGVLAAVAAWLSLGRLAQVQVIALLQAFCVFGAGLAVALLQIRAANLMTPAIPLLAGFLVHAFTRIPRESLLRVPAVILLVLAMPVMVERGVAFLLKPGSSSGSALASASVATPQLDCRTAAAMAQLRDLSPSVLFTNLNLGPAILAYTPQSVTSAAYHRSPDAFWNGIGAFQSESDLRNALAKSGADYLVLCPGGSIEGTSPVAREILSGRFPSWLAERPSGDGPLRLFSVDNAALQGGAVP